MNITTKTEKHMSSLGKEGKTHNLGGTIDVNKHSQTHDRKDLRWLLSGLIGGGLVILVLLFFAILKPGFRMSAYYIVEDPSLLTELLSTEISEKDSIRIEKKF